MERTDGNIEAIDAFSYEGLATLCTEAGQPRFRTKQLVQRLYGKDAHSYDEMTNLPASFRSFLASSHPLYYPELVTRQISVDGTRKYLVRFHDGTLVESVGLPTEDRLTVCMSSQAGCAMDCAFCATGQGGLSRSLSPGEMVWQVALVARDFGKRVSNVVVMGQGEPFANYENTLAALRFINDKDCLAIGARHITVSTCGIVPQIKRFSHEPEQFTLAISLHSAIQHTRDELMPGVRSFDLQSLRAACLEYASSTGRRPTYEYALMKGINDTDEHLDALVDFCKGTLCHVNLIPINSTEGHFFPTNTNDIERFHHHLMEAGIEASIRKSRGIDIDGACGQLRQRNGSS